MASVPTATARRYRPDRLLSEGGFGAVWYATQVELDRPIALKLLHAGLVRDVTQLARFLNEARITAALRHPNIVALIDHGVDDEVPWIAYEYVAGGSLRTRLKRGPLDWREAMRVADQVSSALEAAHGQGVLHRDIKPDNILEDAHGIYKVADFGIAKMPDSSGTLTGQDVILGTPAYLSPVQLRGEPPGPQSDLYALGITLYELIAGAPPITGESPMDVMQAQLMVEPTPLSERVPAVPREVDGLFARLLAKAREHRFASATEFRAALQALMASIGAVGVDAPAPPAAPGARGSGVTKRVVRSAVSRVPPAPPASPARWPLAGAAVLAGALALAVAAWRPHGAVPPAPASASAVATAPAFTWPATTALAPRAPVPAGGRLEVATPQGRVIDALPASEAGTYAFERLPPDRSFVATVRDAAGGAVETLPAFTTPRRVNLTGIRVVPYGDFVRLSFYRPKGARLVLELGVGQPVRWERPMAIDGEERYVLREISGLTPGTRYSLRVVVPDGWGGLPPYAFTTLNPRDVSAAAAIVSLMHGDAPDREAGIRAHIGEASADPRLTRFLLDALEARPPPELATLRAIAFWTTGHPTRQLGAALMRALPRTTEELRALMLHAATVCGAPEAAGEIVKMLESRPCVVCVTRLLFALEEDPNPDAFPAVLGAYARDGNLDARAALPLVLANAARARQELLVLRQRALKSPAGVPLTPIQHGLALTLDDETAQALGPTRDAGHGSALALADLARIAPSHAKSLGFRPVPRGSDDVWDQAFLGNPAAQDELVHLSRSGDPGTRCVALQWLGRLAAPAALATALTDPLPDVRDAAAVAIADGRQRAALDALRQFAKSRLDIHGTGYWALARLGDAGAVEPVMRELGVHATDDIEQRVRSGLAAWAAGELGLQGAVPSLEALIANRATHEFVRESAQDALARLRGAPAPYTFLMPPHWHQIRTGLNLIAGESVAFQAVALETPPAAKSGPLVRVPSTTVGHAALGATTDRVPRHAERRIALTECELILWSRFGVEPSHGEHDPTGWVRFEVVR